MAQSTATAQPAAGRVIHLPAHTAHTLLGELERAAVALSAELAAADAPMATAYDLCRSMDRSFAAELHRSGRHIMECLSGLAPALRGLPQPEFWDLAHVERICARSDGYQPYLVSQEAGLRALIRDAVEAFRQPARDCLARVHATLQRIWETAVAEGAQRRSRKCEAVLSSAVEAALSKWLASASDGVDMLVSMEQGFISAEFFRARATATAASDAWEKASSAGNEAAPGADAAEAPPTPSVAPDVQQRRGLKVGYLYKQSHTSAGSWDRRFFVLSDASLSYYRTASDFKAGAAPRATADVAGSTVADLGSTAFAVQRLGGSPGGIGVKAIGAITLRAEDAPEKHGWLMALSSAASCQPEGLPRAQRAAPDLGAEGATSLVNALSSGDQTSRVRTDASLYVDAVRARLLACLPKSIMVALVHRAERELSSAMYGALNQLSGDELSQLAADDDPGAQARAAALRAQLPRVKEVVAWLRKALGVSKQSAATAAAAGVDAPLDMLLNLRAVGVLPDGVQPLLDQKPPAVDAPPKPLDAPRRPPPPPPSAQSRHSL